MALALSYRIVFSKALLLMVLPTLASGQALTPTPQQRQVLRRIARHLPDLQYTNPSVAQGLSVTVFIEA